MFLKKAVSKNKVHLQNLSIMYDYLDFIHTRNSLNALNHQNENISLELKS